MEKYVVKNPFYLGGVVQNPGEVVELTEEEVEHYRPKDVLGKKVDENYSPQLSGDGSGDSGSENEDETPLTLEEFTALKADEQRGRLAKLEIVGDDGNPEKRAALYAEYLEKAAGGGEE